MWVFTKDGFFSAVWDKQCKGDEVMVRARCREDLCRLSKKLKGYCDDDLIEELSEAGYGFRMKIAKHEWADYLAEYARSIDYADAKKNLVSPGDNYRQEAYFKVWEALFRWQSVEKEQNSS
jgi:hypothetical protein